MQLTMNSNEVSVSSNRPNRFFSWFNNAAKKIAATFTKKKKPAVDKELTEAIRAIEWRTRYDQQRIVNHVYTLAALMQSQKLCTALGVKEPTYTSQRFKNDRMNRFLLKSRTQELMLNEWGCDSYGICTVRIIKTDNSFERKLVRFFGDLNPVTKQLLDGKKTETQRWAKKNARVMDLIPQMLGKSKSLNGYEQQILSALTAPVVIVHVPVTVLALPLETVTSVKPEEKIIDVVAKTLPIEETVVLNTTPLTDAELIKLRQAMTGQTSINKLTIPNLRLYAKARSIHVPGSTTKVKEIRNIIATAQRGSTKLVKI